MDSGADITGVPANLVQELGLPPVDSVQVDRGGAPGGEEDVFSAALEVPVLGIRVARVLQTADPFALLGRDILNQLRVLLDGPRSQLEILS